ncbi:MAG: DUF2207 domain-containing protein [Roseibacillus sp.]|nr:DUF2207 domain-containing protein [Roseibacillus sp.]
MMARFQMALLLLGMALPQVFADERILSFDSHIVAEKGGDLVVTEKIQVRAEGKEIKRGIFRDIPRLQQTKWGLKKKKPFSVLSVKKNGKKEHYVTEEIGRGGMRIRIGQKHKFLKAGVYTYEISYRTGMQLYFEEKRDALYWNVNGTEWAFPIDKVSATVVLPDGIVATKAWGYTGKRGAKGEDYRARIEGKGAQFETTRGLRKKENFTLMLEWPPGLLDPIAYERGKVSLLKDHPGVLFAALLMVGALAYYLVAWFLVGKDPDKGVIIPHYDPPRGFSPGAVRFLDRMGYDNTCFSAGVVGLAVKGVATIAQDGKKTYTVTPNDLSEQKEPLGPDEERLYSRLLGSGSIELKQANHGRISGARTAHQKMLSSKLEKTHFLRNGKWWMTGLLITLVATLVLVFATGASPPALFMMVWLSLWTIGTSALVSRCVNLWRSGSAAVAVAVTLFAVPFALGWIGGAIAFWFLIGSWATGAFIFAGLLNLIFYHLIKAPTHLGRKVMDHIEGFRHYLRVAEEERLNMENPPEKTPELFERFLPYALALDCEQEWSEKFDAVLQAAGTAPGGSNGYRPTFYTGSYSGMNRAMGVAAIGGALTGALASSSTAPSSSGSGGGGSSGGGGGGGGGGGW